MNLFKKKTKEEKSEDLSNQLLSMLLENSESLTDSAAVLNNVREKLLQKAIGVQMDADNAINSLIT